MASHNLPNLFEVSEFDQLFQMVKEKNPLIHCLTNDVSTQFMANCLLSFGASPAMVPAIEDVEAFTPKCQGVLINIGTLTSTQLQSMQLASHIANLNHIPWVLDPISAGLEFRLSALATLITNQPTVIRGNAGEIIALTQYLDVKKRLNYDATMLKIPNEVSLAGIDSNLAWQHAFESAVILAKSTNAVIAVSGEVDLITDGEHVVLISGGDKWMTRVTAIGCSLNAIIIALQATGMTPLIGTLLSMVMYKQIGEVLNTNQSGLGTKAVSFIDALENFKLDKSRFEQQITLSTVEAYL